MGWSTCNWDYCREMIPRERRRCPDHRNMKWWQEYDEHVKHLCWDEEEIPLDDVEDAFDIVHTCRESGGPKKAALQLEEEYGIDPTIFSNQLSDRPILGSTTTF